jgi:hypothetical protein
MFKSAWDPTSVKLYYWDVADDKPSEDEWARITVQHSTGSNDGITNKFFLREGIVTIQLFTNFGQGLSRNDILAKVAVDAFQGKSSPGGVWFRNVRMNEIGNDDKWFQTNILAEFQYDEVI